MYAMTSTRLLWKLFILSFISSLCHVHGFILRSFYSRLYLFSFLTVDQVQEKVERRTIRGKELKLKKIFMCIGARSFLLNVDGRATESFVRDLVNDALKAQCKIEARTVKGTQWKRYAVQCTVGFQLLRGLFVRWAQLDTLNGRTVDISAAYMSIRT